MKTACVTSAIIAITAVVMGVVGYSRLATATIPPPYTAYQADINHDGRVNPGDQAIVASKVGQLAPLPTPTMVAQPHEARIFLPINNAEGCPGGQVTPCDWHPTELGGGPVMAVTSFTPSAYPDGAAVLLAITAISPGGAPDMVGCFRLVQRDVSAVDPGASSLPIAGSEACAIQPAWGLPYVLESSALVLPPDRHFYGIDYRADGPPQTSGYIIITKAEIVVRWLE